MSPCIYSHKYALLANKSLNFRLLKLLLAITSSIFLFSCNSTKYVADNKYLLKKVSIEIDSKDVKKASLEPFVRQEPGGKNLRLSMYMSKKENPSWLKRKIRKLGKAPTYFSEGQTNASAEEMTIEMHNNAYFNAKVTTSIDTSGKFISVAYLVSADKAYTIRNYEIETFGNIEIDSLLKKRKERGRSKIVLGKPFATSKLEEEREQISMFLRNKGYYFSAPESLHFYADSSLNCNQVDLKLSFIDSVKMQKYKLSQVVVWSELEPQKNLVPGTYDSILYNNLTMRYNSKLFLRPSTIDRNVLIYPGDFYNERKSLRTYSLLKNLPSTGNTRVQFEVLDRPDSALLSCNIFLEASNNHGLQTEIGGVSKAGNSGLEGRIGYKYKNLFHGAEVLDLKLRGTYEFVPNSSNDIFSKKFYEIGIETSIEIPKIIYPFIRKKDRENFKLSTELGISFDIQNRQEYTRNFFNFSWKNKWSNTDKSLTQSLNIPNINYVIMPYKSAEFSDFLNEDANLLSKYSYENVFTAGLSYNLSYSFIDTRSTFPKSYTLRLNFESSGNALSGLFALAKATKNKTDQYTLFGNPFAQYVKGEVDFAGSFKINSTSAYAFHLAAGVAAPYGNSRINGTNAILPFEKRYYAGGPNSVRGWSTRELGPGAFQGDSKNIATHVGDIKLELSVEYRRKTAKWLELAYFIDGGNIWTIEDYENQPEGKFSLDSFYKQIAIGTGIGFRFDLDFLIFRIDGGKKVFNPNRDKGERWTFFSEGLGGNFELYFAIGYPF